MSAGELSFAALLLRALRARPGDLSEEELRDGLWLALQMDGTEEAERKEPPSEMRTQRTGEPNLPAGVTGTRAEERREPRSPPQANLGRPQTSATLEAPSRGKEGGGLLFRTPGASALPGALALARALRPLRRRVASQRRLEVDEEATARRISEARAWGAERSSIRGQVVVRPVKERWFELALVVDGAASMAIWELTERELVRLLTHLGAFRDVRVWTLDSEGPRLQLHVGITRKRDRPRSVREVGDPTGRRVILVLTDGVAEAWRDGRAVAALQQWSTQTPVGLVSVLPEELWHGTAMRALPALTVRALRSGDARVRLEKLTGRRVRSVDPERFAGLLPIPVASLEPASMARLAGMLTGTGGGSAVLPRLIEEMRATGEAGPELAGEERVRRFDRLVSPEARRLARLFVVTPLFLPVMRLVQHTMLPRSNQGHLAEVFLGGLLEEVAGTSKEVDAIEYAFRPGVAEALRQTVEDLADTMAVLRMVSRFVAERIGQPLDFGAALVDPAAKFPAELAKDRVGRAFARVSAEVLRPLGGEYAALAERLESVEDAEMRNSAPVPVMNANAPFCGRVILVAGSSRKLTDAQRWAAFALGRGLARRGFGVASSHFEGVDRTVVESLVTTAAKTPAEQTRVRRERVRDFVTADVCAAIVVGGAEGTWSRFELARYLGIPVLGFPGTGGAAARVVHEINSDVREVSIASEAQAEAVAERLFAELDVRLADSGSMPPWVSGEHLAVLRAYALSSIPDPRVLEAVEDAIETGKIRASLEELHAGLQDARPEVRTVVYLCEARAPHVEVLETLANAVVGEARTGIVVMCSGVFRLGLAALYAHCEVVTTLAAIDVLTKASRWMLSIIGKDEHKGWVDGNTYVWATRLQGRALASPKLWVTIQAQTYERIRLEAASDERTERLDAWAEQVQALAKEDGGVRTNTLDREFQTGQDGRRALALACATGGPRTASVGMLYDGIKSSRSGFEQWLALNAALHWLESATDVDGVVGAILEQVLDDGSSLNPQSKSDRAGIATALLAMYGVRRGHGPGAQSVSLRYRWLAEIKGKFGDDTGARSSFESAIRLATTLAEEVQARVGRGLLEARSGDSGRAVAELLFVLERTEQIRNAEIDGTRLKALVVYSQLSDVMDVRRWIAAAAEWDLPDATPEHLGTLHEWGEHLLLLAEEFASDRAALQSCYEQALALAEFLISSPDYEHGEGERELAEKARAGLAVLKGESPVFKSEGEGPWDSGKILETSESAAILTQPAAEHLPTVRGVVMRERERLEQLVRTGIRQLDLAVDEADEPVAVTDIVELELSIDNIEVAEHEAIALVHLSGTAVLEGSFSRTDYDNAIHDSEDGTWHNAETVHETALFEVHWSTGFEVWIDPETIHPLSGTPIIHADPSHFAYAQLEIMSSEPGESYDEDDHEPPEPDDLEPDDFEPESTEPDEDEPAEADDFEPEDQDPAEINDIEPDDFEPPEPDDLEIEPSGLEDHEPEYDGVGPSELDDDEPAETDFFEPEDQGPEQDDPEASELEEHGPEYDGAELSEPYNRDWPGLPEPGGHEPKLERPTSMLLEDFDLENAERRLCVEALNRARNIAEAASLLGITRHALKRRIVKLGIEWPSRLEQPPSELESLVQKTIRLADEALRATQDLARKHDLSFRLQRCPEEEALVVYLKSLQPAQLRKIEILMYHGRGDGSIPELVKDLHRDSHEITTWVIVEKLLALPEYLRKGLASAKAQAIDLDVAW